METTQGQGSGDGYKYEVVKGNIVSAVESGALLPGDRIPSLRDMSKKSQVSITTVMKAYLELEREGRLESRPQSGFYVRPNCRGIAAPRISSPELKPTRLDSFHFQFNVLNAMADSSIVPLGAATPATELLPLTELTRLSRQAANGHENAYGYEEITGNRKLRAQIAYHMLEAGISAHMDDIIVTNGATEALYIALSILAGPGDTVAVESPCYFGYLHILETLGIDVLEIPTHPESGIEIDALQKALDAYEIKACILQPNFNNPFGCLTPDDKKNEIADLLASRNVSLIEDDIVGDLPFSGVRPHAITSFSNKVDSVFISSFSKMLAPGFRIGWIYSRNRHEELLKRKMAVSINTNRPAQLTLAAYLSAGRYSKHLKNYAAQCRKQVGLVSAAVAKYFPENTRLSRPEGGFLLWAVLPEGIDTDILYTKALAEGIGIAPGSIFTSQNRYRNCVRLSCAHPYSNKIDRALKRLGELAQESR
jgi:DNA-binding transcriptional MocR family regulator